QELGRAFNRVPQRVRAYTLNILGSLAGIVLFALCSWLWLPPVAWFGLTALGVGVFLRRLPPPREPVPAWRSRPAGMAALAGAVLLAVPTAGLTDRGSAEGQTFWSPYYRIDYYPYWRSIRTNLIGHQVMIPLGGRAPAYALPHMLHRDAGGAPFERVLIIGAGSGNDLSRALAWGTPQTRIDAVEIDPVIQHLGTLDHPDRPYDDPRVTVHNDDGRNFLRRAAERDPGSYDLIEYALVDSLVLHSGYSNLRLESYLFTREAFADVRRCLKPGGLFVAYNYFRQGWIAARLRDGLREAFGSDPVVLTIPARDEVKLGEAFGGFTLFIAGSPEATAPIRRAFESAPSYWVRLDRGLTPGQSESGFREVLSPPRSAGPAEPARPAAGVSPTPLDRVEGVEYIGGHPWMRFTPASLEESGGSLRPATDDWPFLYLREPTIPALTLRGMGVMALVALGMLLAFRDRPQSGDETAAGTAPAAGPANLELRMFCLGAGFMLIETKAVVQTALLFGSTWMVNTFV
ncbi:MAG TPA: hypothetical protein VIL46_08320, partial [Gemmataceae bacterium]